MADEVLVDIDEMHLRSALSYALQTVKLPRRRTKPPFDHEAEKAERDVVVDAIIAKLKLSKWRVMHVPIPHDMVHANPDPHPNREPTPDLPSSGRAFTLGRMDGHLTDLRVACPYCNRQGVYNLEKQIALHGPDFRILDWMMLITGDCKVLAETPEKCAAGLIDLEHVIRRLR
jgi:hypothetical protein